MLLKKNVFMLSAYKFRTDLIFVALNYVIKSSDWIILKDFFVI